MRDILDSSLSLIPEPVQNLFADRILQKAAELAKKYDARTDSIALYRGLVEIRRMLLNIDGYNLKYNDPRLRLLLEDFAERVQKINSIIVGSRKNQMFALTDKDMEVWIQIQKVCKRISLKAQTPVSLDKITPYLIEASHEVQVGE